MNDEYNKSTTDIILLVGDGDTIEFTSELRLLVHTNWNDWQEDNDELLNDTDKLSIYIQKDGKDGEIWIQVYFEDEADKRLVQIMIQNTTI